MQVSALPPKYDLRDWSADKKRQVLGVTLCREELLITIEL